MQISSLRRTLLCVVLLGGALAAPCSAGLIFYDHDPSAIQPAEHVHFNVPGVVGVGTTVEGRTHLSDTLATFISNDAPAKTLDTPSGNKVALQNNGLFSSLIIHLGGLYFTAMELNIVPGHGLAGDVQFEGEGINFDPTQPTSITAALQSGQNFFSVEAFGGTALTKVKITAAAEIIEDIRNIRIGGIQGVAAVASPEPSAFVLLGLGTVFLVGNALLRRRVRRQSPASPAPAS